MCLEDCLLTRSVQMSLLVCDELFAIAKVTKVIAVVKMGEG